jgi:hypothetical protein
LNLHSMRTTEHDIQAALFDWAELASARYPALKLMFAIPNGGKREKRQDKKGRWFSPIAIKLKKEGVKAGIPDIFLPSARGGSHGLFIEMKAPDGKVTPNQKRVHQKLREAGYAVIVCFSLESATTLITWYLEQKPSKLKEAQPDAKAQDVTIVPRLNPVHASDRPDLCR